MNVDRDGRLSAVVSGDVPVWLHYFSRKQAEVRFNGEVVSGDYNTATGEGRILLPLDSKRAKIEIE